MRDIEIPLAPDIDFRELERAIDRAVAEVGLSVTLRDTLKKFPGCVHWHVKRGREAGTLEITLWPEKRRAWFTVQSGRTGDWIDDAIEALQIAIRAGVRD